MAASKFKLLFTIFLIMVNIEKWTSATIVTDIESLAEQYPYIVPLLGKTKDYLCTGSIIREDSVLTSAGCLDYKPHFVSVGTAVLNPRNSKNLLPLCQTIKQKDFKFRLSSNLKRSQIRSNIGVAMLAQNVSDSFIQMPALAKYFTADLRSKHFLVVGYGKLKQNSSIIALQSQKYKNAPCLTRKWQYCTCGVERDSTHVEKFGEGAPLILDSHIIAVTIFPCGGRVLNGTENFNVFTVLSPYFPLIENPRSYFQEQRNKQNVSMWDKIKGYFTS